MRIQAPIRFINKEKTQFYNTLTQRVDAWFQKNGLSKRANPGMVVKTVVLLTAYLLPFVVMVVAQPPFWVSIGLWALMGFAMAGVGMGIMHDACHGAYSTNERVNEWLGRSINLVGGSGFTWKLQHNFLHHTFTNIVHYDEDIADKPLLRMSPHTEVKPVHRFQWIYALLFYSITTLYWSTVKDFMQLSRYSRNGVNKNTACQNRISLAQIIAVKMGYFSLFLGLPIAVGLPVGQVLAGFVGMHLICGTVLTVVFQLAHTVEQTAHPRPNAQGNIENEWAIHQLNTTVNFSRKNRWLTWYVGGLNFQVEHHLFPKICHVHYPKIAGIVKQTAAEFKVPYLEHKSFAEGLRSHFATLRRFGKMPKMDELMG